MPKKIVAIGLLLSACNPPGRPDEANQWTSNGSSANPSPSDIPPGTTSTSGALPTSGDSDSGTTGTSPPGPDSVDTEGATTTGELPPPDATTTGALPPPDTTTTGPLPMPVTTFGTSSTGEPADESTTGCGGEFYQAEAVPPNVLITLDRSGSMHDWIDGGTKWNVAKAAINDLTALYGDQVYFGLSLFPGYNQSCNSGASCGPGAVFIAPAPDTAAQIQNFLAGASTCSYGTPIAEHVNSLIDYTGLEDLSRANYVLLVTDGIATCADPVPPVDALRQQVPEVKTFVVGFGSGVDPAQLNDMADAGGTALPNDPKYFQADDAMALQDAFASIVGSVLSCTYKLDNMPPNADDLYVFFDGVIVTRDPNHADGWDYDPITNTITFYGPACDSVKGGEVEAMKIVFGCPNPG